MIIVCDIDGTVADNSHREGFIQGNEKDWDAFYRPDLMAADIPLVEAQRVVPMLAMLRGAEFVFLTGRPERTRETTAAWFHKHFGIFTRHLEQGGMAPHSIAHYTPLVMRGDTDHRRAWQYKESSIQKIVSHARFHGPIFFIDDDLRNEDMYRRYGVFLHAPKCWESFR